MDRIWNDYTVWLLNYCRFGRPGYTKLMDQLINSPFEAVLERDLNRISDGEDLRSCFLMENGLNGTFYNHPVSVLEVLIALAVRVDGEYLGNPNDPRPDVFFWEMICNLGLDKFDDKKYDPRAVFEILDVWISRKFDKNGVGSPFPVGKNIHNIHKNIHDQRKIEIWMQVTAYINIHFM